MGNILDIGNKISSLRKEKKWSQGDLAKNIGASREIIGKYERNENLPSIEMIIKIADAFAVTLDYLVGEGQNAKLDKQTLQRILDIQSMDDQKRKTLFDLVDTYIRDFKTRQSYAS
ncbi:helix-turn-helix domain-containing protein [Crocinitomix algicola]|uniref:helix-turn-helix domain-containing protein n=1 Tax=Crocinitomix algicola TaxID=1740263 RepID=UPI000871BD9F|nr:helix-turn-helix transcriptional regulator [Crocinitomix algicola]